MRPRHYTAENMCTWRSCSPAMPRFNEAAALHRGKRAVARIRLRSRFGFNEAAALHRGKRGSALPEPPRHRQASMRPRHYTAENEPARRRPGCRRWRASMRPRHYTAENVYGGQQFTLTATLASMRPRHYTAENEGAQAERVNLDDASMRPRHYTAENPYTGGRSEKLRTRFNEAAALHRGKPARWSCFPARKRTCFNEAAALHRGKPGSSACRPCSRPSRFNEAAALHRGKPRLNAGAPLLNAHASMRPRHYTAENLARAARSASATCMLQ